MLPWYLCKCGYSWKQIVSVPASKSAHTLCRWIRSCRAASPVLSRGSPSAFRAVTPPPGYAHAGMRVRPPLSFTACLDKRRVIPAALARCPPPSFIRVSVPGAGRRQVAVRGRAPLCPQVTAWAGTEETVHSERECTHAPGEESRAWRSQPAGGILVSGHLEKWSPLCLSGFMPSILAAATHRVFILMHFSHVRWLVVLYITHVTEVVRQAGTALMSSSLRADKALHSRKSQAWVYDWISLTGYQGSDVQHTPNDPE